MSERLKVVHYLNQYFAGVGGEEEANAPVKVIDGTVGPGRLLQQILGGDAEIVATVMCGDNYVNEERDEALAAIGHALSHAEPDLLIAGPAFNAGRYGLACGEVCRLANAAGIASVTAMYHENPGVLEHGAECYILPTGESAAEMKDVLEAMTRLGLKLARGEEIGSAEVEGYMPRGIRRAGLREHPAAVRAADMLVARLNGRPFDTELPIRMPEVVEPAAPIADLTGTTIGLVTTGSLVPRGNPDRLVRGGATEWFRYSIDGLDALSADHWESVHRGFYTNIVNQNPNYVLPLNIMREMEGEGAFADIHPWFFSTTGVGTAVGDSKRMGAEMAEQFLEAGVRACVLVAT
ncbi:MAG TPA: glycine/betaine/sarcosine/D-proline family reductase selenoprotein B [Dehalococcoidia bacterium]|jgi:glycine reductase|nr:glycine/betaine/sarcosine/D-proline family reductase selenoprotein B [SAR202 cluster bacterium]HAL49328.1 glycine/betaine/sarcosine/D-proline family reductase selenoprotein B [Dehalococcoidia bacterium]|tara:strand:+ start:1742 stop:2791 length:1050 start_codon:yes stop_codon:yes gene_type:complete